MKLGDLAEYLKRVEQTNSRIEKQDIVWEALQAADSKTEEDCILALTTCRRFDDNGVSKKTVRKAAASVIDGGKDTVRNYEQEHGSLPDGVHQGRMRTERIVPPRDVPVSRLWQDLELIENETSTSEIEKQISRMLSDYTEPKWVTHGLLADDGVSLGFGVKSAAKMLRRNYDSISKEEMKKARALCPDIIELNRRAPNVPLEPQVGTAFKPMLASSKDVPQNIDNDWFVQPKYDGARVLVHYDNGEVRAFSRRLNDVTDSLPELEKVAERLPPGQFILDGEAVAYKDGEPQDFQYIMTRFNREKNIEEQEIDVKFHFFDLLLSVDPAGEPIVIDGRSNISRMNDLKRVLDDDDDLDARSWVAPIIPVFTKYEAQAQTQEYIDQGYEGAILKRDSATYEYDKRSQHWRKVKAEKENVDLRITEIIEGEDDRAGRMGAIRLETEDGVDLGKCGTGFTEEDQKYFWENREELVGQIVEVDWFELQAVDGTVYSLRFPVFEAIRDKDEADSLERIKEL